MNRQILSFTLLVASSSVAQLTLAAEKLSFNREIRPILADRCFACHGPDVKGATGLGSDLRLHLRELATKPNAAGKTAIVPGNVDGSEMVRRIFSDDENERMPPTKSNKRLTADEKSVLKRWIAEGAEYQAHWAFVAPERGTVPVVQNSAACRNEIDRFVVSRLERSQLTPSAEADRTTLIRRLSFDLIGLPPSPAEVAEFLADRDENAYEKLVDRLLQSPHYGERMAMPWLDAARYADSNGYQTDAQRFMWPWRDWVINAFNSNMPFDQFTVEQLAGDLLPNATVNQQIATGFNRNHRITTEGGSINEEWLAELVIDRVDTTAQVWMGLTAGCARCHDHKYDPLSQKEFYQLFAFFNNVPEPGVGRDGNTPPVIKAPRAADTQKLQELETVVVTAEHTVKDVEVRLPELQAAWERETAPKLIAAVEDQWKQLEPSAVTSSGGATLTRLPDGSYLAGGKNPSLDVYTVVAAVHQVIITGILLEAMPHESLPGQSLGRHVNGNYVLSEFEAEVVSGGVAKPVKFAKATASYSQPNWPIENVIDGKAQTGWAIDGNDSAKRLTRQAIFIPVEPIAVSEGATLTVRLKHEALDTHAIGRFRVSITSDAAPALRGQSAVPDAVSLALRLPAAERSPTQLAEITKFFRATSAGEVTKADAALVAASKSRDDFAAMVPTVMVMQEMPQPRETHLLIRGQYDQKGEVVTANLPAALPPLSPDAPRNRLGFAQWLVAPTHPLTARVAVNRMWERFFGVGIVKSSENFGMQGEYPSQPELLDWLATEFIRSSWDMKALQKTIVMSATYRQSSALTPVAFERDPENRLLARGPRFRLQSELIRDNALAIAGLLGPAIGGPSVRPYQPDGVWDEVSSYGDLLRYKHDTGEGLYRRSMYTIWKRTAAPPQMLMFDSPSREFCQVKRSRTNTPLQALTLLNEITFVEASRVFAQQVMTAGGETPAARLTYAFRRATARAPSAAELRLLSASLERRLTKFRQDPAAAVKLISLGDAPRDEKLDPVELAAYTVTASVLLNLDEVVTKE